MYNAMTSTELAKKFRMITKIWYDNNMIDLTGQVFGKWTVLYRANKVATNGAIYWHCKCECGR